jgi:hypothetical protein
VTYGEGWPSSSGQARTSLPTARQRRQAQDRTLGSEADVGVANVQWRACDIFEVELGIVGQVFEVVGQLAAGRRDAGRLRLYRRDAASSANPPKNVPSHPAIMKACEPTATPGARQAPISQNYLPVQRDRRQFMASTCGSWNPGGGGDG